MLGPGCCLVGPRPYQARPWLRHCLDMHVALWSVVHVHACSIVHMQLCTVAHVAMYVAGPVSHTAESVDSDLVPA